MRKNLGTGKRKRLSDTATSFEDKFFNYLKMPDLPLNKNFSWKRAWNQKKIPGSFDAESEYY